MNCQRCKKRTATVHVTDVVSGGKKEELHLCDECAAEKGYLPKPHKNLDEILTEFIQLKSSTTETPSESCPNCGMNWATFKQSGLLGCPDDYDLFSGKLVPLLERAHAGGTHHCGKVPKRLDAGPRQASTLVRLKRELASAVEAEDYERAARLRDQIRQAEMAG